MTEQEKMLEMLRQMAREARETRMNQLTEASTFIKEMFDSYVSVGFTRAEALELTKSMVIASIERVPIK